MADFKFVYTVSGIDLSDAQKAKISHEIAAVVARSVLGDSHEKLQPDLLTLHGVAGGKMIRATAAASAQAFVTGGCGGGAV